MKYKRLNSKQRRALRMKRAVVAKHGLRCRWCNKKLVALWKIKSSYVIKKDDVTGEVEYYHQGNKKRGRYLTIDHLLPRGCGGPDTLENMVPSCKQCNNQRDHDYRTGAVRKSTGGPKGKPNSAVCGRCNVPGLKLSKYFASVRYCDDCIKIMESRIKEWKEKHNQH